jgi:hypothetical protein
VPNEDDPLFYMALLLIKLIIFYGRAVWRATGALIVPNAELLQHVPSDPHVTHVLFQVVLTLRGM